MLYKLALLPLTTALHINRHHLMLKLQALQEDYHCQTDHSIINGDVYPKQLCLKRKLTLPHGVKLDPVLKDALENRKNVEEDVNEADPANYHKSYSKKPGERFNDCFCDINAGWIESSETGACIRIEACEMEYEMTCRENEVYGLFISDEPFCKGYLDVNVMRSDPDIFDEIMDKLFGVSDLSLEMNWMDMFAPEQFNKMLEDACNEKNSPIAEFCNFRFANSGLVSVSNRITSSASQNKEGGFAGGQKVIFQSSFRYNKSVVDTMKMKRGCHCKSNFGRKANSNMRYMVDSLGATCYNLCVPENECGSEFLC